MAVDPSMMNAGPMIPPAPPVAAAPMPSAAPSDVPPAVAAPMPSAAPSDVPPAVAALPGMAQLAQAQSMQMADHQRQMAMMQEEMQKQIMMLIASLPTPNPAGEQAVSAPLPPMMSGAGATPPLPSQEMSGMSGQMPVGTTGGPMGAGY